VVLFAHLVPHGNSAEFDGKLAVVLTVCELLGLQIFSAGHLSGEFIIFDVDIVD
jgi:hypothetical protein